MKKNDITEYRNILELTEKDKYYNLMKGTSSGYMDTTTEYLKKSNKEKIKILINDFKIFGINLLLLFGLYSIQNTDISIYNKIFTIIYTIFSYDLATGITHLTLDNPLTKLHPISAIRNAAWQFQDHHDNPIDTTYPPLIHVFLNKGLFFTPIIIENILINAMFNENTFLFTSLVFLFGFISEWNHRVIHTNLTPKHYFHNATMYLMKNGILITPKKHYMHHQTYDVNFCTFTGWTDNILNKLNKRYFEKKSRFIVLFMIIYFYFIVPFFYLLIMKMIR